ncbi:GT-D fold domain-containing glycosyltransferase [Seonamhaeicola marinus]|uniref:GT-D fold domain-containing glycosyltransferase n=1 Tax=Seonamhaeicola marinus TaxID=1912246 RepID=UPI0016525485|nr:GT-D fold domain-containing glycosyltransferase [Seonamhaeicola marinus]
MKSVKIKTSLETLNDIKRTIREEKRGAYLRFGDGDIYLMRGLDDILHKANPKIAKEMKQAFSLNIGELHKALAIHSKLFGFEKGMQEDMHLISDQNALNYLAVTHKYFNLETIYTPVALHYLSTFDQDNCMEFLRFLKTYNPIFVGNEKVKIEIVKKLFGEIHVKTPVSNSYDEIDRIENDLIELLNMKKNNFQVVVVAMGCPGRILQKRILKKGFNVYLFDFGSLLDALNGENSRLWIDIADMRSLQKILTSLKY